MNSIIKNSNLENLFLSVSSLFSDCSFLLKMACLIFKALIFPVEMYFFVSDLCSELKFFTLLYYICFACSRLDFKELQLR